MSGWPGRHVSGWPGRHVSGWPGRHVSGWPGRQLIPYQSLRFAQDLAGIKCEPTSGFSLDTLTSL